MFQNLNVKLDKLSFLKILSIFVAYSVLVSCMVQLIALPYLFPQLHHGNGLLYGGDWFFYQAKATELSILVAENGWENWELRPKGHGMVGVVAAIYSFFGLNKPFILIPFFSLLHGIGALSIFLLIEGIGVRKSVAFYSAIPYLIFPTSLDLSP